MLVIGLAGGKPDDRAEIAKRLRDFGKRGLVVIDTEEGRKEGMRLRRLSASLSEAGRNRALGGAVITHVLTQLEADLITSMGGEVWHVMGRPSDAVAMRLDDRKVTHFQGGCRHFLDPLEALTEALLESARAY